MPRYYFHVIDGRNIPDDHGTELPNDVAAIAEARAAAGELIRDFGPSLWDHDSWQMNVVDHLGTVLLSLKLAISTVESTASGEAPL